jgi:eukaryotic-like serine/threonine-protein kinase
LPTETEWEYACRGGPLADKADSAFDFYFDKPTNQLLPEQANFQHGKGLHRTCRVGSFKPNRLGLHDMHGNVFEWCHNSDWVDRGGSWHDDSGYCRVAYRGVGPPSRRYTSLGLRVARVLVGKKEKSPNKAEPKNDRETSPR